ncbi:putative membrane protein [Neisseria meningitidis H44/76]|uniref:Uncharacterized protein n=2 Tax=Neisseria meningitidis serogroup B TaxID=491 RepID=A0A0H5QA61_NEIMI|nr:putative membrane protein [Neisseria meningitidis H44/76]KER40333.1 putative membrane protein [Neisseria meningitidis 992008]CRY98239.1 hypothetical protein [Neisseria meningitidis serogroup B]
MAKQELVVPKSIPITFAMWIILFDFAYFEKYVGTFCPDGL